jgi:hypothetical protein
MGAMTHQTVWSVAMSTTETLPAPEFSGSDDPWRQEQRAFHRLLPELLRTHSGQFVAIHGGQVVGSGDDKLEVARQAYARCGYVPIFVSRVSDAPARPVRIPSPRHSGGRPA